MEVVIEYYLNAEQFEALQTSWKALADKRQLTAADMVLYNVLRGKDPQRGFIARKTHIQGNDAWYALTLAKRAAKVLVKKGFAERFGFEPPTDILQKLV